MELSRTNVEIDELYGLPSANARSQVQHRGEEEYRPWFMVHKNVSDHDMYSRRGFIVMSLGPEMRGTSRDKPCVQPL